MICYNTMNSKRRVSCFDVTVMRLYHHSIVVLAFCFKLSAATTDIVTVWRHKADVYMQLLHSIFCVGAIISPFVTKPFLAEKSSVDIEPGEFLFTLNYNMSTSTMDIRGSSDVAVDENGTSSNVVSKLVNTDYEYGHTNIYIFYTITAGIGLITTVAYVIMAASKRNMHTQKKKKVHEKKQYSLLSRKTKVVFTTMLAFNIALYLVGERGMAQFLMTFLISRLNWSKSKGSYATSVFWIAVTLGRLLTAALLRVFSLGTILMTSHIIMLVGGIILWLSVNFNQQGLVWVSIFLIGLGMAPIFGGTITWISQNITKLTGRITSIFFVSNSIGSMSFPVLLGYLMDAVSYDWFIYFQLIVFVSMNCLIVFIFVCYRVINKPTRTTSTQHDVTVY